MGRVCSSCQEEKPLTQFYWFKRKRKRFPRARCKACWNRPRTTPIPTRRVCRECQESKKLHEFRAGSPICISCVEEPPPYWEVVDPSKKTCCICQGKLSRNTVLEKRPTGPDGMQQTWRYHPKCWKKAQELILATPMVVWKGNGND